MTNLLWVPYSHLYHTLLISTLVFEVVRVAPPDHFLAIPGSNISFTCYPVHGNDRIQSVDWLFNETRLEDLNLQEIQADFVSFANGLGRLRITRVPIHFNGTTVQCIATLSGGNTQLSNIASILILQGLPPL